MTNNLSSDQIYFNLTNHGGLLDVCLFVVHHQKVKVARKTKLWLAFYLFVHTYVCLFVCLNFETFLCFVIPFEQIDVDQMLD